jgi:putative endonuclease
MYYVYLLRDINKKLYIGYSSNLRRRMAEHNNQKVYTTKRMHGPKLIYYEAYISENQAKIREKKLKQFGSSYKGLMKRLGLIGVW